MVNLVYLARLRETFGLGSEQIKVGAMARSERAAKWNEVIRIEERSLQSCWQFSLPR